MISSSTLICADPPPARPVRFRINAWPRPDVPARRRAQAFREKILPFPRERIPVRVVHARGCGAHGCSEICESLSDLTRADLFQRARRDPAFARS
ncbi:catalase [Halovulum marinum]|uniref:catalase n=1 Tax=Halovulum marinum TaxID=2662447 RepID=UPI0038996279